MDAPTREAYILRTLGRPSPRFWVGVGAVVGVLLWFLYAWSFLLRYGLITTGLGDWGSGGGVPWGLFIGSYIWWIGIAHGGIIVSALVRLFNVTDLKPVARLAELLTLFSLSMAASFILFHLGRPDRMVVSILRAYPWAVFSSPLLWDVTVITLYAILTATYILLTIRRDLYAIRGKAPALLAPLHQLLLLGYRQEEDEKVKGMAWWLALCLIILAPLFLHGGVIPWLFSVVGSKPGWYGPAQGPTFLSIALTSALSGIIVVAYIFRRAYGWEEVIPDAAFHRLTFFLIAVGMIFLWFQVQILITGLYAPPGGVAAATKAKVASPIYWAALALVAIAIAYLGAQKLWPRLFSLHRTFIVAFFPLIATLMEKTLFVVEGNLEPGFTLYRAIPGSYWPSWIEVSSVLATIALTVLLFMGVAKVIPVVEVMEE
jgi:molybdopterin-containing oxidoreductase family membrane subunit